MNLVKLYFSMVLLLSSLCVLADSNPERRAAWQAKFEPIDDSRPGMVLREIEADSPLALAGIKPGDRLIAVNKKIISTQPIWNDLTDALVANHNYQLLFKRNQNSFLVNVSFPGIPKESHKDIDTIYDFVTSDYGIQQRVIVTKPKGNKQPMPAVVILQGLSCSSIEKIPNRKSSFIRLLTDLVEKSSYAVLRIEKPGMGDSEGNCSETDFNTELNGYESAIRWFLKQPYVANNQVIVYGNSMGSALAPYVANKFNLAGVISDGTFVRSWFEHMLEIERRILAFKGLSQAEISQKITTEYIPLYYGMLVKKQSYQEVINDHLSLADSNYHQPAHMYGRPMSFYHQLQDFDVAGEWQKLKVPARIRWGMNDWIMSEADNDMIIDILKQNAHQDHLLYKQPGLDHWQTIHQNPLNSFQGKAGSWDNSISQVILGWFEDLLNE